MNPRPVNPVKHFLKLTDLTVPQLDAVLEHANRLKQQRGSDPARPLARQTWALMFHKSSTRTRVSFEVGIHELGGHPMNLDQSKMQTGRGETVEDTAKVLSRYIHGIIIRTYSQAWLEQFAAAAGIPVINGLTNELHPCQVLADLLTLAERWGKEGALLPSLRGRKLVFYGDCASNMAHSWIVGAAMAGMQVELCGPPQLAPKAWIDDVLRAAGLTPTYSFSDDPLRAAAAADAIYTDVWVSMGDEDEREQRLRMLQPYQVNRQVMAQAKPDAFFLHCLPAHEGEEVTADVYHSPQSIVFDEAENRLHAQKALMAHLVAANQSR